MNLRQLIISIAGLLLTLVLTIAVASFIIKSKKANQQPPPPKIIRKVNSALVEYGDVVSQVTATGRVVSQQSVEVIAEVQGKLLEGDVSFKKGQNFRKGDVLVRIYNRDAAYTLQARKSGYLNLLANILPDLKIDYPDEYEEWVRFFEQFEIHADLPDLPPVGSSQLKIFLASRSILSEYYAIKSDEVNLKKYNVIAPFNGAIQNVLLEVGSVANPGSRIAEIIKTSQLEVEIPVESSSAEWLRIGDKAILKTERGELIGHGIVKRKSSFVDMNTQSINIYLGVTDQKGDIFAGEYLKAEFPGMVIEDAMEIPRNAVFNRNMVFTVEEGFLSKKQINLLKINEKTIIFNGLPRGSEVVIQPLANANESMQVQTEFTKPPEAENDSSAIEK
jgi:multidrug efflux pump subunit AcrA (membrane-fusion protein)